MHIFLKSLLRCSIVAIALPANAQTTVIPIETKTNAVVLEVNPENYVGMVYFGKKLVNKAEYNAVSAAYKLNHNPNCYNYAYTSAGARNLLEPAIAVTHADGNKSLDLKYVSFTTTKVNDDVSITSIVP